MRSLRFFAFVAVIGSLSAADRWYEIRLAGRPAGYVHESSMACESGHTCTDEEMMIVINRLGSKVEIKSTAHTVEDGEGHFISVQSETSSSKQTTVSEAKRLADSIVVETKTGDKTYTRTIPATGPLYGPEGIDRLTCEHLKKTGDEVSFSLFVPELGAVSKFTRKVTGGGDNLLEVQEQGEGLPGKTKIVIDLTGQTLSRSSELPFGTMEQRISNRETALKATAGGSLPAESYDRTLARSNVRLPDARSIDRIKLKLTQRQPDLGWPSFDGPGQRVIEKSRDTVILEVAQPSIKGAIAKIDEQRYLAPNALLQSDDSEVIRIAHHVVGSETDRYKAARKLQDWVADHLKLGLGIAAAPASEVARNREGTCIAYSILLASLERAVGIPSRVAMGYVYVEGIWGGHAWTEALIDGRWIPLDGAVYRPGIADAARFQFSSYTFEDNMGSFTADAGRLYGNLDVTTLEYTINGRTIRVPESARDHTIEGDTYTNAWLGFSVRKPESARFANLDAVYPDATVLDVENGSGKVHVEIDPVRVDRNASIGKLLDEVGSRGDKAAIDGRTALVVSSPLKARLVSEDGQSLWVVTAEGTNARHLLDQVLSGWKWVSVN